MKNILALLFTIILIFSCTKDKGNSIQLKIGDLEVTAHEIKKQYQQNFPVSKKNKKILNQYRQELINKYLTISDAYNKQYDTISKIKQIVKSTSDFMMIQENGYLWKKQIAPIIEEFASVTPEKIKKRSKLFDFDIIVFSDKDELIKILKYDTTISNLQEYSALKNKLVLHPSFKTNHSSIQWPFEYYAEFGDYLYSMEPGQVSKLMQRGDSYFYFYLNRIEEISVTEENKIDMQTELKNIKRLTILKELETQALIEGDPSLKKKALESILAYINDGNSFDTYNRNDTVISYTLNNNRIHLMFNDFIENRSFMPMKMELKTAQDIEEAFYEYYYDQYLIKQAKDLGLFELDHFLLDQKNFQNNLIYNEYIVKEVANEIEIDSFDVQEYYNNNPENYTISKNINVDCYSFEKERDANNAWITLSDFYRINPPSVKIDVENIRNLSYTLYDYTIDRSDLSAYKKSDFYKIQNLEYGFVSYSIFHDEKFVLYVHKGEDEKFIRELSEVYSEIESNLREERKKTAIKANAEKLKNKYTIDLNKIDLSKI